MKRMPSPGSRDLFLAADPKGVQVVLEVLGAPQRNQGLFDPTLADEAATYAGLSHPNLVKVVDLFSADGRFVIALEYIDGTTLDVLQRSFEGMPVEQTDAFWMYVLSCVFDGLAAAHEATAGGKPSPVLHRNVAPSNVQVAWDGSVKLGNFNVANVATVLGDSNPASKWGTFDYLSPEQVTLLKAAPPSDVYSATLMLWELLAGRKAIERGKLSDDKLLELMASPKLPPLDVVRPGLDANVLELVRVGLEIHPAKRNIDAAGARDVLRSAIDVEATRLRFEAAVALAWSSLDAPTLAPPALDEKPPVPAAKELAAPSPPNVIVAASEPKVPSPAQAEPPPPAAEAPFPRTPSSISMAKQVDDEAETVRPPAVRPAPTASSASSASTASPAPTASPASTASPTSTPSPASIASPAPTASPASTASPAPTPSPASTASPAPTPSPASIASPAPTASPASIASPAPTASTASTASPAPTASTASIASPAPTASTASTAPTASPARAEPEFDASREQVRRKGAARIAVFASLGVVACILVAAGVARLAGHDESTAIAPQEMAPANPTATAAAIQTATPTAMPITTPPAAPTPTASPTASPTTSPAATSTPTSDVGTIELPRSSAGHRIFVDGHIVGEGPKPVRVKCGPHAVRIGSAGHTQHVDVPCGQSVTIER